MPELKQKKNDEFPKKSATEVADNGKLIVHITLLISFGEKVTKAAGTHGQGLESGRGGG